jgi:hypothetical protein
MNTRQASHSSQASRASLKSQGKKTIRDIGLESNLYSLGYYNPNDCMTEVDYKTYIKGQIVSNLRFDESHGIPLTIKDMKWNINTSPRYIDKMSLNLE